MYLYGMRLRGFSIGCQPKQGLIGLADDEYQDSKYHDVIAYDRKLTEDELQEYSLDYIGECIKNV